MNDLFQIFAVDENLENTGTWQPIAGDTEFLIARTGNKAYGKVLTREFELHRRLMDLGGEAAEAKSHEVMLDVLTQTVLLGWRTKQDDGSYLPTIQFKGEALTFSVENARKVIGTPEMKDLRRKVVQLSDDAETYRLKQEKAQGES